MYLMDVFQQLILSVSGGSIFLWNQQWRCLLRYLHLASELALKSSSLVVVFNESDIHNYNILCIHFNEFKHFVQSERLKTDDHTVRIHGIGISLVTLIRQKPTIHVGQ